MLPPEILSALKAYVQSREPLPTGVSDTPSQEAQLFSLGQSVQGAVLAEMSPGVFTVRVAQQLIQLNLPETIRTGDIVQLQVLSLQPRLTFGLSAFENPASTSQQLSDAARLLSTLAPDTPTKALIQGPSQTPLLMSAGVAPQPLVGALRQAIQGSGLFYESHQVEWMVGGRTIAQLMTEPQNQPQPGALQDTAGQSAQKPAIPLAAGSWQASPQGAEALGSPAAMATSQSLPVPAHLQALVQQQLQALETGHILWQGQVFPGQTMDWEIWRQPGQGGGSGADETQTTWATSLVLDLPRLGQVKAQLRWSPAGAHLTLSAASEETQALMNRTQPQLLAALKTAGVPVSSAVVGAFHDHL